LATKTVYTNRQIKTNYNTIKLSWISRSLQHSATSVERTHNVQG